MRLLCPLLLGQCNAWIFQYFNTVFLPMVVHRTLEIAFNIQDCSTLFEMENNNLMEISAMV